MISDGNFRCDVLMAFCTQLAKLPKRMMERAVYKKPKLPKTNEITELCHL